MSDQTPEPIDVLTAFMVVVQKNGRVAVLTDSLPPMNLDHTADLFDVETYASQVGREAGRVLALRMATPAPEATPADRISEALSRRNEES